MRCEIQSLSHAYKVVGAREPSPHYDFASGVADAAKSVSGQEEQVGGVLALHDYPTRKQRVSATWLGGGVQNALMAASAFLVSQGKLDAVLDDHSASATPRFAQMVLDGRC